MPLGRALDRLVWWPLHLAGDRGGHPRGVLWVWVAWDALLTRLWHLREVRPGSLLRFRVMRYRGRETRLQGGTVVRPGDRIVEIHADNASLQIRSAHGSAPHAAVRALADDLASLTSLAASGALGDVRAIHGVSLLASAAAHAGAEVRPLPRSLRAAFVRYFFVGLIALYHPRGWSAAARYTRRWPAEIWVPLCPSSAGA